MNKIIDEIIEYFKSIDSIIEIEKETEKSIKFKITSNFRGKEYIEDIEIKKDFITEENKEFIMNNFNYLYENSLNRYKRGD